MRIPAFAIGTTPSPYTPVEDSAKGQREAVNAAGIAAAAEGRALADAGQAMSYVGKDVYAFTKRIEEQEALTFVQSTRGQDEEGRAKIRTEWEPTVSGPNAREAPGALQEKLGELKKTLLANAPTDLARQYAEQDLNVRHAYEYAQGVKYAQKEFKDYSAAVQDRADQTLVKRAYMAKGDANQLQAVLDEGKAAWMAHGTAGIWISPADAELEAGKFENKAVVGFLQGQLDDPTTARKAIADFRSGKYADKLDTQQLIRLGNQVDATQRHLEVEARRAQAEAKANLHERQNMQMYELLKLGRDDPKQFASQVTLPVIDQMVYAGKISPAQGQQLVSLKTGADRHSDPVVRDEAYRLAATGGLTNEWIAENGDKLSGPDLFTVTGRLQTQVDKSVEGRTAKLFIDDMFKQSLRYNRNDSESMQDLHEAQVAAQDYAAQRLKEGAALPLVKAEVRLRYDPDIGDNAPAPKNKYVDSVPDNPDTLKPYFEKLWVVDSKNMKKDEFNREWRGLLGVKERSEKRQLLRQQIQGMGGK